MKVNVQRGLAALLSIPVIAQAQTSLPPPHYVDALYVRAEPWSNDTEAEGAAMDARYTITDRFYVRVGGSFATSHADFDVTADSGSANIGVGARWAMNRATDLQLSTQLEYARYEIAGLGQRISEDDIGYSISAGLRAMPWQTIEVGMEASYLDVLHDSADSFGFHGAWYLRPQLGLITRYNWSDDSDTFSVGLRWAFGSK